MYSFSATSPDIKGNGLVSGGRGRILNSYVTNEQAIVLIDIMFTDEDEQFDEHFWDNGQYSCAVHFDYQGNVAYAEEGAWKINWQDGTENTPEHTIAMLYNNNEITKIIPFNLGLANAFAHYGTSYPVKLLCVGGNNEFVWVLTNRYIYVYNMTDLIDKDNPIYGFYSTTIDLTRDMYPAICLDQEGSNRVIAYSQDGYLTCKLNNRAVEASLPGAKHCCACFIQNSRLYLVYKNDTNTAFMDRYSIYNGKAFYETTIVVYGFSVGTTKVAKIHGVVYCTTLIHSSGSNHTIRSVMFYTDINECIPGLTHNYSTHETPGLTFGNVLTDTNCCALYVSDGFSVSGNAEPAYRPLTVPPDISGLYVYVQSTEVLCANPTIDVRVQGTTLGKSLHMRIRAYADSDCIRLISSKDTISHINDFKCNGTSYPSEGLNGDNINYLVSAKLYIGPVKGAYIKVDFK